VGGIIKFIIFCAFVALLYGWYQDGTVTKVVTGVGSSACKSKWAKSGFYTQWDIASGCQVYVDGRRIPEANVQVHP
jgi:hypothetical protein